MSFRQRCSTFCLFWLVLLASSAFAQAGTIQGTLVDSNGATVPNGRVYIVDVAKGVTVRETTSDKDGAFQLLLLPRGTYTLKAEAKGFKTLENQALVLDAYQIMSLGNLKLEVGDLSNSVQVTADPPLRSEEHTS